ncbi:MAG TPA: M14 family zinc carboxypeptidase, partial [Vicinamibacterales bacterium]|nr:M14 family zinc carboxypeptidase [Vicinamibacterales bacterium]
MRVHGTSRRRLGLLALSLGILLVGGAGLPAQQWVTETRDPKQTQDEDFAKAYKEWTGEPRYGSPLVDHLPKVPGIPTPKDILGYHIGAPNKLTYYADILKYYRALAAATPRVKIETIGKSDEDRELVVVWVSSDANIKNLQQNKENLAKLADPRGLSDAQISQLIATTKPNYHFMGGLHSGETGPSEMLMELVYRLATETSPFITGIRNNVIVSVTPVADADGRDRNVDWFYRGQEMAQVAAGAPAGGGAAGGAAGAGAGGGGGRGGGGGAVPYWGKYVHHDNNRDINLSQMQMRAVTDWYFTAHPPIMHDLHESLTLLYTYSGGPPQNPNLDPILFSELPFFSNWEMAQMAKWGMPGVYTHGFMDGWSPGYLGSVAYNHNGMMRMYETQSGRESSGGAAGRGAGPVGRGGAPVAAGASDSGSEQGGRGAARGAG